MSVCVCVFVCLALYAWSSETENLNLYAGRLAGVLLSHGYTLEWTWQCNSFNFNSKCSTWAWHTHTHAHTHTHTQPGTSALFFTWKHLFNFILPVHHSWSFQPVLNILWSESPVPLRSHSTAAALLYSRPTARAIIGRRGRVAQLTRLIPRSQSSAVLFKSLPCRSQWLISEMPPL